MTRPPNLPQKNSAIWLGGTVALVVAASPSSSRADGGASFVDIAVAGGAGIDFHRTASANNAEWLDFIGIPLTFEDVVSGPSTTRGIPGVALFDFDGDGDLDIYATNGPGTPNSLYKNLLADSGVLTFVDVAEAAGVAATDLDCSGVAYADTDNDGDQDLVVLSINSPNRMFENNGDGTFDEITATGDIGDALTYSASASFGDINEDGLLDLVVANAYDHVDNAAIFFEPFALSQANQLFVNHGDNVFVDESDSSGITTLSGFRPPTSDVQGITWAAVMIDYDQDGDTDIVFADDQAGFPHFSQGGIDRGVIHVMDNDGTGHFTDVGEAAGVNKAGAWMGLAFADFNSDGDLDFFASNFGDYAVSFAVQMPFVGLQPTQWFLGAGAGTFVDPGLGDIGATPFGWGVVSRDFDNDGDSDVIFHGGLSNNFFFDLSNPGAFMENDGQANFTFRPEALDPAANHIHRTVKGVAAGDLDGDGQVDVVSVSSIVAPDSPISPVADLGPTLDPPVVLPFDGIARFQPNVIPTGPDEFFFNPDTLAFADGNMSVELNETDNGNGSVVVDVFGTVDLVDDGVVNRNGFGATVAFRPIGGVAAIQPMLGGSSYASQNSDDAHFGLGSAPWGRVDVLWPGGVRNRLYGVADGETVRIPEIPCSIDTDASWGPYTGCVASSLLQLVYGGELSFEEAIRLYFSARWAYIAEHF